MRILHTADWHLGRSFGEHRLLEDQARFCDWLVEVAVAEGIDLVAVAGDLFDRSIPPTDAVTLLGDTFARLREAGVAVAAITGNHDSAERMGAYEGLLASEVHLRGGYGLAAEPTVVPFADGELAVVAVPYLDPHMAPLSLKESMRGTRATDDDDGAVTGQGSGSRLTHERVLDWALGNARSSLPPGTRSLVLSHAFVTGAAPSDSERMLAVGEAAMVSAEAYRGFDYVALGHLHRAQRVAGADHIRYSGSPLPYSFTDTAAKQVVIADMAGGGGVAISELEVGTGRGVATVRGRLEELEAGEGNRVDWVRAELTDELRPLEAMRRLRHRFPFLVEVDWVGGRSEMGAGLRVTDVRRRTPEELAREFWCEVTGEAPSAEVAATVADALIERSASKDVAA